MYCNKCGKEIDNSAVVCPFCGVPTTNYQGMGAAPVNAYSQTPGNNQYRNQNESSSTATAAMVCAFLIPLLGIIFGAIGLSNYQDEALRKKCKTAIGISVSWIVLGAFAGLIISMGSMF